MAENWCEFLQKMFLTENASIGSIFIRLCQIRKVINIKRLLKNMSNRQAQSGDLFFPEIPKLKRFNSFELLTTSWSFSKVT